MTNIHDTALNEKNNSPFNSANPSLLTPGIPGLIWSSHSPFSVVLKPRTGLPMSRGSVECGVWGKLWGDWARKLNISCLEGWEHSQVNEFWFPAHDQILWTQRSFCLKSYYLLVLELNRQRAMLFFLFASLGNGDGVKVRSGVKELAESHCDPWVPLQALRRPKA